MMPDEKIKNSGGWNLLYFALKMLRQSRIWFTVWNPQTTQIVKALWLTAFHGNAIIAKDTNFMQRGKKHAGTYT